LAAQAAEEGVSIPDIVANEAQTFGQGLTRGLDVAENLPASPSDKLGFLENLLPKLAEKFGKPGFACQEIQLPGGVQGLIGQLGANGKTPLILVGPTGKVIYDTAQNLLDSSGSITAYASSLLK
jgi:hypothetical protein